MNEEELRQFSQLTDDELIIKLNDKEIDLSDFRKIGRMKAEAAVQAPAPLPVSEPAPAAETTDEEGPGFFDRLGQALLDPSSYGNALDKPDNALGRKPPEPTDDLYRLAMEVKPEPKEDGIITEIGTNIKNALDYPADKANELFDQVVDRVNEALPGDNPLTDAVNFLDENVFRSADEQREAYLSNPVGSVIAGGAEGIEGGFMIPLTVAGAIANQNTDPWSDPPEMMKGNLAAEASFEVMQILTPTLVGGAIVGPTGGSLAMSGGLTGLLGESALETATQDSPDEVLLSRTLAYHLGKASDALNPGSGEQLVTELLNGSPASQVYLTLLGMFQNMGINVSPDAIRYLINRRAQPAAEIVEAAAASGKSVDEVDAAVNNTSKPQYTPDAEPTTSSAATPDSSVAVSRGIPDPWDDSPLTFEPDTSLSRELDELIELGGDPDQVMALDRRRTAAAFEQFSQSIAGRTEEDALKLTIKKLNGDIDYAQNRINQIRDLLVRGADEGFVDETSQRHWNRLLEEEQANVTKLQQQLGEASNELEILKAPVVAEDAMTAEMSFRQTADAPTTLIKQDGDLKSVDPNDFAVGDDALGRATRRYFFNIDTWAVSNFAKQGIEKAGEYYRKLGLAAPERLRIAARAANWYNKNRDVFLRGLDGESDQFDSFLQSFYTDMTETVPGYMRNYKKPNYGKKTTAKKIKEFKMTDASGTIVAGFIGEELGTRIQKAALIVSNLQNSGMNTDIAMRQFIRLVQLGENFFVPARKAARAASQGLAVRQKNLQQKAFDMLGNFEDNIANLLNKSGKAEKEALLETIVETSNLNKLFRKAKNGDAQSKQLLDAVVNQLAYSDPSTMLSSLKLAMDTLPKAQRAMTSRGIKQLFYAMMLTRGTTQAAAFAVTASRMILEPLIGGLTAAAGDALKLDFVKASEKALVSVAQFAGGWGNASASMSAFRRAFKENVAINSGERVAIGQDPYNLAVQSSKAKVTYQARLLEIAKNEEGPLAQFAAWSQWNLQRLAFNPYINYGPRLLQAQDEGFKVMRAAQVAQGDAMYRAFHDGALDKLEEYSRQSFKTVFSDGVENGRIRTDTDIGQFALDSSRRITFQRALPDLEDANFADKLFIALEGAAETSAIVKYFNPFVRMGWDVTSQTFESLPGLNVVYSRHFGRKARKIIDAANAPNATAVDKARLLELESGYAAANLVGAGAVWFSWQGLMTGSQGDDNRPRDSFIIPLGNGNSMAVDFSRFEPYATWMRVISDSVNSYRRGAMSRGEYDKAITGIVGSMAQSTLDKNILAGVVDMTEIFNYQNWNGGSIHTIVSSFVGFSPAIVRALGQAWEPYGKISYQRDDILGNTAAATVNRRILGGAGLPEKINPFLGKPEYKVAVGDDAGIEQARLGMILQEFLPFKTANVVNSDSEIYSFFDKVGFVWNHNKYMLQVEGAPLDKDQQKQLGIDMFEVAKADEMMLRFIKGEGNRLYKLYRKALEKEGNAILPGDASRSSGTNASVYLQAIRNGITNVINKAKIRAMREGQLRFDTNLIEQLERNIQERGLVSTGPGSSEWKGLYETAAQIAASNELPDEVQTILDIA